MRVGLDVRAEATSVEIEPKVSETMATEPRFALSFPATHLEDESIRSDRARDRGQVSIKVVREPTDILEGRKAEVNAFKLVPRIEPGNFDAQLLRSNPQVGYAINDRIPGARLFGNQIGSFLY